MQTANERLYRASVLHQVLLSRQSNGVVAAILKLIREADADIVANLQARLGVLSQADLDRLASGKGGETTRLARLLEYIRSLEAQGRELIETGLVNELEGLATAEAAFQQAALQRAAPVALQISVPSVTTLEAAVRSRPFQGRILREWAAQWGKARRQKVMAEIRQGVLQGDGERAMARRIRDVLGGSQRSARMIARTAHTHVTNYARERVAERNEDITRGVVWVSVLDSRTSAICRARSGKIYPINSGPRPPAHPNCRSTTALVFKNWRQLGYKSDELTDAQKEALSGDPDVGETYSEYFAKLPRAAQVDIIGETRTRLFRKGGLDHDDLVSASTGREWTLDELKRREPEAFEKAFGSEGQPKPNAKPRTARTVAPVASNPQSEAQAARPATSTTSVADVAPIRDPRELVDFSRLNANGPDAKSAIEYRSGRAAFTSRERSALKEFKAEDYARVNAVAVDVSKRDAAQAAQSWEKSGASIANVPPADAVVGMMDKAIKRSSLSEDTALYRGVNNSDFFAMTDDAIGQKFKVRNFQSTSLSRDLGLKFATGDVTNKAPVLLKINGKKGASALDMDQFAINKKGFTAKEREILLPRNSQYEIKSISTIDGVNVRGEEIVVKVVEVDLL